MLRAPPRPTTSPDPTEGPHAGPSATACPRAPTCYSSPTSPNPWPPYGPKGDWWWVTLLERGFETIVPFEGRSKAVAAAPHEAGRRVPYERAQATLDGDGLGCPTTVGPADSRMHCALGWSGPLSACGPTVRWCPTLAGLRAKGVPSEGSHPTLDSPADAASLGREPARLRHRPLPRSPRTSDARGLDRGGARRGGAPGRAADR